MSNKDTKENLSRDVKHLRDQCASAIANSASFNRPHLNMSPDKASVHMTKSYIQGLQAQIQNSETDVATDENLIVNQFIAEMEVKNDDVEKLIAFTQGTIFDTNNEIDRLSDHIKQVVEALTKPQMNTNNVSMERLERVKEDFRNIKKELHKLIKSMFKNDSNMVSDFIGDLMQERLNPETNGYVQVTEDMFSIAELLHDIKIVSKNPYVENEVKLAYSTSCA